MYITLLEEKISALSPRRKTLLKIITYVRTTKSMPSAKEIMEQFHISRRQAFTHLKTLNGIVEKEQVEPTVKTVKPASLYIGKLEPYSRHVKNTKPHHITRCATEGTPGCYGTTQPGRLLCSSCYNHYGDKETWSDETRSWLGELLRIADRDRYADIRWGLLNGSLDALVENCGDGSAEGLIVMERYEVDDE